MMVINVKRLAVDADYWDEVAPLGSTHYWEPSGDWYQDCGYYALTWTFGKKEWVQANAPLRIAQPDAIPRPQPDWVGGLPPVGCECERQSGSGLWVQVTVLGYHGKFVWVKVAHNHEPVTYFIADSEFRPTLTPEQRQREELCDIASKYQDLGRVIVDEILSRYTLEPKP